MYLEAIPAMLAKKRSFFACAVCCGGVTAVCAADHIQVALHKIFATMACCNAIRAVSIESCRDE